MAVAAHARHRRHGRTIGCRRRLCDGARHAGRRDAHRSAARGCQCADCNHPRRGRRSATDAEHRRDAGRLRGARGPGHSREEVAISSRLPIAAPMRSSYSHPKAGSAAAISASAAGASANGLAGNTSYGVSSAHRLRDKTSATRVGTERGQDEKTRMSLASLVPQARGRPYAISSYSGKVRNSANASCVLICSKICAARS